MKSDLPKVNNKGRWIAAAAIFGVLFVASLLTAIYFWPHGDLGNERQGSATRGSATQPGDNAEEAPSSGKSAQIQPPPVQRVDPQVLRRQAWDKVARHLAPADAASLASIDRSLQPIEEFFDEHRDGARPFARSVLSLRGKWKYVKTRGIFGGDADDHRTFLDEKFREHIFDPEDLKTVVQQSIADYVRAVQSTENKLLVTVRAELDSLDPQIGSAIAGAGTADEFAASYQKLLKQLVRDVTRGARADLGQFVGSFVAAEVTQQLMVRLGRAIATRLGVSAGVLGAGATGGAASAGVTIGLAVVIDVGIEWLLSLSGADAASKVTARVEESLDNLHAFLLEGDPAAVAAYHRIRSRRESFPTEAGRAKIQAALKAIESKGDLGLRRMLLELHHQRARLREEALRKLVLEGNTT